MSNIQRRSSQADSMKLRQLGSLASRVEDYEQLLEELSLRAAGPDQDLIRKALDRVHWMLSLRTLTLTPTTGIIFVRRR